MPADYFTQEHLLRLLTRAPNAFWRFDCDVSLEAAARMARFLDIADVRGTFYVAVKAEEYNPFSAVASNALAQIAGRGHRFGMHVHLGPSHRAVTDYVREQYELFLAGYPEYVTLTNGDLPVSFHMPSHSNVGLRVLWRDFVDFDNAYAKRWEGRYLSDSRRRWDAEKDTRVSDDMQINLHPEHWFS